jgi:hypothetical protein
MDCGINSDAKMSGHRTCQADKICTQVTTLILPAPATPTVSQGVMLVNISCPDGSFLGQPTESVAYWTQLGNRVMFDLIPFYMTPSTKPESTVSDSYVLNIAGNPSWTAPPVVGGFNLTVVGSGVNLSGTPFSPDLLPDVIENTGGNSITVSFSNGASTINTAQTYTITLSITYQTL